MESYLDTCPVHGHNDCLCGKTPKMHEKSLDVLQNNAPQLLKKLGEVMRENETLKKQVAELEIESRHVPLCADHAERWFCDRYFKDGDCWFCQTAAAKEKEFEAIFEYALGKGSLAWYRNQMPKVEPVVEVVSG